VLTVIERPFKLFFLYDVIFVVIWIFFPVYNSTPEELPAMLLQKYPNVPRELLEKYFLISDLGDSSLPGFQFQFLFQNATSSTKME
jgi:hypothetical protein